MEFYSVVYFAFLKCRVDMTLEMSLPYRTLTMELSNCLQINCN